MANRFIFVSVVAFFALMFLAIGFMLWNEYWRYNDYVTVPVPAGAPPDPFQTPVSGLRELAVDRYRVLPRFLFVETGLVLRKESFEGAMFHDFISAACPCDISMAWGKLTDRKILDQVTVEWTSDRTLVLAVSDPALQWIGSFAGNNHLVVFDPLMRFAVNQVTEGDNVTLTGYLVDIEERRDSRIVTFKTSTRRDDHGVVARGPDFVQGSCEIVYPVTLRVNDRLYRIKDPFRP